MNLFLILLTFIFVAAPFDWGMCAEKVPLGLPPVPIPADNPQTPEKITLGKRLFEDKRFSADGSISCATCHDPSMAFTDGLAIAEGIEGKKGVRNTPTVINAAYYTSQFWDGRAKSLEEQSKGPFVNPVEHGLKDFEPILSVIKQDKAYVKAFRDAFGIGANEITIDHVAKAIAAFERTVISGDSPFDRYMYKGEKDALSESAKRGLNLFRNKARCQSCHKIGQVAATFTDNDFHNLGVGFSVIEKQLFDLIERARKAKEAGKSLSEAGFTKKEISELGRFAITFKMEDIGRFKTPTLRNIELTGPYMHDGSLETLEDVIEFYNQGGEENPMLDSGIRPLGLTDQEKKDLVEFMKALTSPEFSKKRK